VHPNLLEYSFWIETHLKITAEAADRDQAKRGTEELNYAVAVGLTGSEAKFLRSEIGFTFKPELAPWKNKSGA